MASENRLERRPGLTSDYAGYNHVSDSGSLFENLDHVVHFSFDVGPTVESRHGDLPIEIDRSMRYADEHSRRVYRSSCEFLADNFGCSVVFRSWHGYSIRQVLCGAQGGTRTRMPCGEGF